MEMRSLGLMVRIFCNRLMYFYSMPYKGDDYMRLPAIWVSPSSSRCHLRVVSRRRIRTATTHWSIARIWYTPTPMCRLFNRSLFCISSRGSCRWPCLQMTWHDCDGLLKLDVRWVRGIRAVLLSYGNNFLHDYYEIDECAKHTASSKSIIFTSPVLVNAIFDGLTYI